MFQHLTANQKRAIADLYQYAKTEIVLSDKERTKLITKGILVKDKIGLTPSAMWIILGDKTHRDELGIIDYREQMKLTDHV